MENNVINAGTFKEKRPRKKYKYTEDEIETKINRETKLAKHYLWLFCIKNALWLFPLVFFIVVCIFVDLYIVLGCWHNPTILFSQLKFIFGYVLVYIAGLYTDELRRKMTKH